MENGIYIVRRVEEVVRLEDPNLGSANAALGTNQQDFGDQVKTVLTVKKILDETGQLQRKEQSFKKFGISVTDVDPNTEFKNRMRLRQQAAADRAIAREQLIQEEEQRLLAIAKGEREVAERQAQAKVRQIEQTTNAETEKQLAITSANKLKEQAEIDRERSVNLLEKAEIDAEAVKVAADVEAYAKAAVLEADNALVQKLEAEISIQRVWAEAYAKRNLPTYVFGAGDGDTPTGGDQEAQLLQQLLAMEYADYDRAIQKQTKSGAYGPYFSGHIPRFRLRRSYAEYDRTWTGTGKPTPIDCARALWLCAQLGRHCKTPVRSAPCDRRGPTQSWRQPMV